MVIRSQHHDAFDAAENVTGMLVGVFAAGEISHLTGIAAVEPLLKIMKSGGRHCRGNPDEFKPDAVCFGFDR